MTGRVLVVDDDHDMCRLLAANLSRRGFEVLWSTSGAEAIDVASRTAVDAVLADVEIGDMNGIDLCGRLLADTPDLPVTMLTAFASLDTAVAALRAGAYDFLSKPPAMDELADVVERAVRRRALRAEMKRLPGVTRESIGSGDILGESRPMRQLVELLDRIAESDASVLVTGESGTGKELVARALHSRGHRRQGPFAPVNCAAVPGALLESELFGHVRGAFTDARTDRAGLFSQASGGVLFLDEIGELPLALQPKLLRALQEHAIRPIGADREILCDVRVIAATNQDLRSAVDAKRFREDLYYRIDVIHVHVPPLRARGMDVLLLAQHFLERCARETGREVASLSQAAAARLLAYGWPGNVRELQNCIEHAVAFARHTEVGVGDLPEAFGTSSDAVLGRGADWAPGLAPLEEIERRHIVHVLEALGGNRTLAARALGLDRKTLYRKLARFAARS